MKKPKITVRVIKEEIGYSAIANVGEKLIASQGDTFDELKEMVLDVVNLSFEEEAMRYSFDEIAFEFDLASFFNFYKVINAKALAERIGMNQSLLAQYINGVKRPSSTQTKRILQGVHQIGKELSEVTFLIS
jgi:transcriptional regulator with XRE-family HTH domain